VAHLLLHRHAVVDTADVPQSVLFARIGNRVNERCRKVGLRDGIACGAAAFAEVKVDKRAAAIDHLHLPAHRLEEGRRSDDRVAHV
jgi:hypothetical protein